MHRIAFTSLALLLPVLVASPASAAGETCDGRAATIVVPVDQLAYPNDPYYTKAVTGTPGDDVIVGTELADTIDGGGGNDVICGVGAQDDLTGGVGDDRLFGGLDGREHDADPAGNSTLGDLVRPGPGDDYVDLGRDPDADESTFRPDQVRYDDSSTAVEVDLAPVDGRGRSVGEGTDTIVVDGPMTVVGSPFDDRIIGSPYDDLIMSDRGEDYISGEEGDDVLLPDIAGFDVMETSDPEGPDFASPDTVDGGDGDDFISSQWGASVVEAGAGDDYVRVESGSRDVDGNFTADGSRIAGGPGHDTVIAKSVRGLRVSGGAGDDRIVHSVFDRRASVRSLGGSGDDQIVLSTRGTKIAPAHRITVNRPRSIISINRTVARLGGYERYSLTGAGTHWIYRGTDGRDRVSTRRSKSLAAYTRGGRDDVEGTRGPDHLDLGRGRDTVDAKQGRDTCLAAERAKGCEIRGR